MVLGDTSKLDGGRRRSYFFQLDIPYLPGQIENKLEIT
jgi:hypothetical protein